MTAPPASDDSANGRPDPDLERRGVDVIRGLSMDAPARAKSGHQGTAMALAPAAHVLFTRVMNYDMTDTSWPDRDRFVLSCGHASILQYSMLYLCGSGLTLEDLEQFRQWGSLTPGHPEVGHTAGVEVTTGPLGQGFATAVGMAVAERSLRAEFGPEVCDHRTWVIASDGDLAEGVSHEAASFAGHQKLGHLNVLYDDNRISIDGSTDIWLSDDPAARFTAYGWHVVDAGEVGEDLDAIERACREAAAHTDAPSIVILRTHIATPSPTLVDTPQAHGLAFGPEQITATKAVMGIPDEPFWVPDEVLDMYRSAGRRGVAAREAWQAGLDAALGGRAAEWNDRLARRLPDRWRDALPHFDVGEAVATRVAHGTALAAAASTVPGVVGGGADLTGNTGTTLPSATLMSADEPGGAQIPFGVREHAMGTIVNGIALHGGLRPLGGTFLVFSDYMRPAVRLAALMGCPSLFVWSHDSIAVGEDGPTHQPIEQLAALRAIPHLTVFRPADANETVAALAEAFEADGPVAMITSRQNLPVLVGTDPAGVARGAYVLRDVDNPAVTLMASGSEVSLCVEAAELLDERGVPARVISVPSWERALADPQASALLADARPALAVEAGVAQGWYRWADDVVGLDHFGASAPGGVVMEKFGFTRDAVALKAAALVGTLDRKDPQ